MNQRLLLDGCSFTYGLHLDSVETLEHHFTELGYDVTNLSRPGKSNSAISLDVYQNLNNYDVIIVGWTFSSRWHLRYHNENIDLLPSREYIELPYNIDAGLLEDSYKKLHKSFYSLFDVTHWNAISDMLIDNTYAQAQARNKSTVFFSWEPRNVTAPVYLPHVTSYHRLPDGHLNADGTTHLFQNLINILENDRSK